MPLSVSVPSAALAPMRSASLRAPRSTSMAPRTPVPRPHSTWGFGSRLAAAFRWDRRTVRHSSLSKLRACAHRASAAASARTHITSQRHAASHPRCAQPAAASRRRLLLGSPSPLAARRHSLSIRITWPAATNGYVRRRPSAPSSHRPCLARRAAHPICPRYPVARRPCIAACARPRLATMGCCRCRHAPSSRRGVLRSPDVLLGTTVPRRIQPRECGSHSIVSGLHVVS